MSAAVIFLLACTVFAVWVGSLYVKPFGPCPHCHGRKVVQRGRLRVRTVVCPRCKGAGRRQRPGSRTVHQLARRIERERARQRKMRQAAAAASHPEE